jgi:thiamine biosynthesis lipoprotein
MQIVAVATGLVAPASRASATLPPATLRAWRGVALGADASLQLYHPDIKEADRLIAACLTEVNRLEKIFSLYRPDSALCRLNRKGQLDEPPLELVTLLATSRDVARSTGGAFDPTVQPLWEVFAGHFAAPQSDPEGPPAALIRAALDRVGVQSVEIEARSIRFRKPGMAVTLNGIAQGYVTDRVVELLRANGMEHSLADMGEVRALGARPDGAPWSVGLEDPIAPGHVATTIALDNRAVSTSGGYGLRFDPAGRFNHIFVPSTGECSHGSLSVSVVAETATLADALSTAFCVMPLADAQATARRLGARAYFTLLDGSRISSEE